MPSTGSATDAACLVIPGDGIGREVVPRAANLLARLVPTIRFELAHAGVEHWRETGEAIPDELIARAAAACGVLFGCTGTPAPPPAGYRSPILTLRHALGVFANARFCKAADSAIDVLVVRECSEGLYVQKERELENGAVAESIVTITGTARVARAAAKLARGRAGRVTIVHKANVLRLSDGLFRRVAIETLEDEGVAWDEVLTDAAAYYLVAEPKRFDTLLTNSYAGDVLSNVAAAVAGGLGIVPSIAFGDGAPLAEPIHGSAPDLVGRGTADPTATILSGALLLEAWGRRNQAVSLREAVFEQLRTRKARQVRTDEVFADLGARLGLNDV